MTLSLTLIANGRFFFSNLLLLLYKKVLWTSLSILISCNAWSELWNGKFYFCKLNRQTKLLMNGRRVWSTFNSYHWHNYSPFLFLYDIKVNGEYLILYNLFFILVSNFRLKYNGILLKTKMLLLMTAAQNKPSHKKTQQDAKIHIVTQVAKRLITTQEDAKRQFTTQQDSKWLIVIGKKV